jgi:N-acetylmuramoyl-L-alanine amidase
MPPTRGDRRTTVFVDAGHGGRDPGAQGHTSSGAAVNEKAVTLAVARGLTSTLRARGFRVVMSRTGDTTVVRMTKADLSGHLMTPRAVHRDLLARVACANAGGSAVLVSLHFNSLYDPAAGGVGTYYDSGRPFAARNRRLAKLVQNQLVTGLHRAGWTVPDRGLRNQNQESSPALTLRGAAYGHLLLLGPRSGRYNPHPSRMPGVLTEPLFLSRPTEADIAVSARGQRVIAAAIAGAVSRFLSH